MMRLERFAVRGDGHVHLAFTAHSIPLSMANVRLRETATGDVPTGGRGRGHRGRAPRLFIKVAAAGPRIRGWVRTSSIT